jgi:hypothetical protein
MIDFFKNLTSMGYSEQTKFNKIFEEGKKAGYEIGILDGKKILIKDTKELGQEELNEIYKFLAERNIVFCYDLSIGGLRIRKNNKNK